MDLQAAHPWQVSKQSATVGPESTKLAISDFKKQINFGFVKALESYKPKVCSTTVPEKSEKEKLQLQT